MLHTRYLCPLCLGICIKSFVMAQTKISSLYLPPGDVIQQRCRFRDILSFVFCYGTVSVMDSLILGLFLVLYLIGCSWLPHCQDDHKTDQLGG